MPSGAEGHILERGACCSAGAARRAAARGRRRVPRTSNGAVFVAVRAVLLSSTSAAKDLGLRVHVVGTGVHVELVERCDHAHEVRLTRRDVELRRYTQNDGSAQPKWGGDRLAVPTGVSQRLLARVVGPLGCRRDAGSHPPNEPASGGSVFGVCGEPVLGARYAQSAPFWLAAGVARRLSKGARAEPRRTPARPAVASARQVSSCARLEKSLHESLH